MIETLPEYLRERSRVNGLQVVRGTPSGNFVLYWLRTVVRADENSALDVAMRNSETTRCLKVSVVCQLTRRAHAAGSRIECHSF